MAYHVAAWVYWFDMYVDIDKDGKTGDFNAILLQEDVDEGKRQVWVRLLQHLDSAEKMLNLLPYNENNSIIYNIITLGMPLQMQKSIPTVSEGVKYNEVP